MTTSDPGPAFDSLRPMLLTEGGRVPADSENWLFELKYDGYRLLAQTLAGQVRLQTKSGADATRWFPEVVSCLAAWSKAHPERAIFDGEVCVLDELGRSDFDALHARARARRYRPGAPVVVYCVFDVLVAEGRSWLLEPLHSRKTKLAKLLSPCPERVLVVSSIEREGKWLFEQAVALRLEGIVAKRRDSVYQPGERSRDWRKVKRKGAVPAGRFSRAAT